MVEAAVRSAASGRLEHLDAVLEEAHTRALRDETRPDVRDALAGWTSAGNGWSRDDAREPA
jgi:hypothetical protein